MGGRLLLADTASCGNQCVAFGSGPAHSLFYRFRPPAQKTSIQTFSPPSLLKIDVVNNADGSALLFVLLCTPTRPGHCRHIGCNVLTKATKVDPGKKAGFNAGGFVFGQKIPPWLLHPMAGFFLHQVRS